MDEHLHDNLRRLHDAFGEQAIEGILKGDRFTVDGVEFVCRYASGSTATQFHIVKSMSLVSRYRELCERFVGTNIVELGIAEGGSTALIALLARPRALVAVDLEPVPLDALAEFARLHGLTETLRTHYGLDQSDRHGLGSAVDADLGGQPIDLVIDDCSHIYERTRTSFEILFPRLRPGGWYVIEDWNNDHVFRDALRLHWSDPSGPGRRPPAAELPFAGSAPAADASASREPLTRLAMELAIARSSQTDVIARVTLDEFWIVVERGPASVDVDGFRLDDECHDYFGFLARPGERPSGRSGA